MLVSGNKMTLRELWIYAAWREGHAQGLVHVICIPSNLGGFLHLAEADVYEQEMTWAGLSPSGRS